jgi:ribosomal protein S8
MERKPQETYDPPGVGSIVPLRSQYASDISAELVKKINQLLESSGYLDNFMILPFKEDKPVVSMKEYLDSYPSRIHGEHWIDSGKQVSAIHPETYLPFFF